MLYDEDIVEEKAIGEWAAKGSRKYASKEVVAEVRKRAQPFLDWLNDAEEDSSEDQGGSDGEDIEVITPISFLPIASLYLSKWVQSWT